LVGVWLAEFFLNYKPLKLAMMEKFINNGVIDILWKE